MPRSSYLQGKMQWYPSHKKLRGAPRAGLDVVEKRKIFSTGQESTHYSSYLALLA